MEINKNSIWKGKYVRFAEENYISKNIPFLFQ